MPEGIKSSATCIAAAFGGFGCALGVIFLGDLFHGYEYHLSNIASARFEAISFCLLLLILFAMLLHRCWNVLAREFPSLPSLTRWQSRSVILVASLLSGALIAFASPTWDRLSLAGDLRGPHDVPGVWLETSRRSAMESLRDALWQYAQAHDGRLPDAPSPSAIPRTLLLSPDPDRTPYIYLARSGVMPPTFGFNATAPSAGGTPTFKGDPSAYVIAYEPAVFGNERFALLSSGEVVKLTRQELIARVKSGGVLSTPVPLAAEPSKP